jgi:hypothetical protein
MTSVWPTALKKDPSPFKSFFKAISIRDERFEDIREEKKPNPG